METYKITWYKGNVLEIKEEYKSIVVQANSIDVVDFMQILPEYIKKQSYYQRIIQINETTRNVDYGSYINFIQIHKIT